MAEKTCPLGHTCDKCLWYVARAGQAQGQPVEVKTQCAVLWMGDLLIPLLKSTNGTAAAVESFRNEMVRGNGELSSFLLAGQGPQRLTSDDKA